MNDYQDSGNVNRDHHESNRGEMMESNAHSSMMMMTPQPPQVGAAAEEPMTQQDQNIDCRMPWEHDLVDKPVCRFNHPSFHHDQFHHIPHRVGVIGMTLFIFFIGAFIGRWFTLRRIAAKVQQDSAEEYHPYTNGEPLMMKA
jgi:hypothetical protein